MYSLIPLNIKVRKLLRYMNLNKMEAVMSQIHSHQAIHTIIDISNLFNGFNGTLMPGVYPILQDTQKHVIKQEAKKDKRNKSIKSESKYTTVESRLDLYSS